MSSFQKKSSLKMNWYHEMLDPCSCCRSDQLKPSGLHPSQYGLAWFNGAQDWKIQEETSYIHTAQILTQVSSGLSIRRENRSVNSGSFCHWALQILLVTFPLKVAHPVSTFSRA